MFINTGRCARRAISPAPTMPIVIRPLAGIVALAGVRGGLVAYPDRGLSLVGQPDRNVGAAIHVQGRTGQVPAALQMNPGAVRTSVNTPSTTITPGHVDYLVVMNK